jgi:hypothetical protein
MTRLIHYVLMGLEIYLVAAFGLVLVSLLIGKIRSLVDKNAPAFEYPRDVAKAEEKAASEPWWHRQLVALDIWMNALFFNGFSGETMSTHAWRASLEGKWWGVAMNWWLNGFQAQHGPQAASGDLWRSQTEVNRLKKLLGVQ